MPNPRVTVRFPVELYQQLPTDERERSRLIIEAVQSKLNPPEPEDEVSILKGRVEAIEKRLGLR